jgi:hypothetical protein
MSTLTSTHPLFRDLRNGLLWHSTGCREWQQIERAGSILPNNGRVNTWGKPTACQELGGVSLFDFTTAPEREVLEEAIKWEMFLSHKKPVTIVVGLQKARLPGRLTPYPENKEGTTGNIIPVVEVCHRGLIPISCIDQVLLVCPADVRRYRKLTKLDAPALQSASDEFGPEVQRYDEQLDRIHNEMWRALWERAARDRAQPE